MAEEAVTGVKGIEGAGKAVEKNTTSAEKYVEEYNFEIEAHPK